jgi:hypothetical protein
MRFLFVNWAYENHGSAQDLYNYVQIARTLGHEVALYGPPNGKSPFNYSLDIDSANAVIFIFEFTTRLEYAEKMGFLRLLGKIPREKRVVIDCDGKYNEAINVEGDYNHADNASSSQWIEICDSLSCKIFQPTFRPLQNNVRPFFFHAYNPDWERPLDVRDKDFGLYYVGNNWFRWRPMLRVLRALEPVRERVGRIGIVGQGWDTAMPWGDPNMRRDAYLTDPVYLRQLSVEVLPPVRFDQVIDHMGMGVFSPVIYRPLFDHLQLATCRTFETLAANTIPLFCQDADFVETIYGEPAVQLILPDENPHEKIMDIIRRPDEYARIVSWIRKHLAREYSYLARLMELIDIVES